MGVAVDGAGRQRTEDRLRVRPPERAARRRLPELTIGLLLVALGALVVVLWTSSATARVPVLAVARDVDPGTALAAGDLRTVDVAVDADVPLLRAERAPEVVGRRTRTGLAGGTLLSEGLLVDEAPVAGGSSVVGLDLAPGQFPSPDLRTGDVVKVISAPTDRGEPAAVLVERAEVFSAGPPDENDGSRLVSVVVAEADAAVVAGAAAQDAVRLALLGGGP